MESATARRAAPTALGDDIRQFVNLTFTLAVTEWKLRFFGSVLGYLWTLMRPLLLFGVLYLVFSHLVKVGTKITHYPVYLLESIVMFQFFADSTSQGLQSLLQRESLLRKMRFPRMVIPLSVVLTNLFKLGMNMIAVLVFVRATGVEPRWTWLLLPVPVLALIFLASGSAMLTSALYVRFRDLGVPRAGRPVAREPQQGACGLAAQRCGALETGREAAQRDRGARRLERHAAGRNSQRDRDGRTQHARRDRHARAAVCDP